MKTQLTKIKWMSTTVFALVLSTGAHALNDWNIQPTLKEANFTILNCISVPKLPELFQTTVIRTRVISEGGKYSDLESYVTQTTPTSISADTTKTTYSGVVAGGGGIGSSVALENGETTITFNSVNGSNYMDITEERYEATDYLYQDVHQYSPFLRKPVGTICDENTWLSNYNHTSSVTTNTGAISALFPVSEVNRIVSIDVEKIVEAGVFTTYQHSVDDGNHIITNWVDVASGVLVASESRDSSTRALIATKELIEFFVPILGEPPVYHPPIEVEINLDDNFNPKYDPKFTPSLPKSIFK